MKEFVITVLIFLALVLLILCLSPTAHDYMFPSQSIAFIITVPDSVGKEIEVLHYKDKKFNIVSIEAGVYHFETGELRGGKTTLWGRTIKERHPYDSNILRINWPGIGQCDFSINDLRTLPSLEGSDQQAVTFIMDRASFENFVLTHEKDN